MNCAIEGLARAEKGGRLVAIEESICRVGNEPIVIRDLNGEMRRIMACCLLFGERVRRPVGREGEARARRRITARHPRRFMNVLFTFTASSISLY